MATRMQDEEARESWGRWFARHLHASSMTLSDVVRALHPYGVTTSVTRVGRYVWDDDRRSHAENMEWMRLPSDPVLLRALEEIFEVPAGEAFAALGRRAPNDIDDRVRSAGQSRSIDVLDRLAQVEAAWSSADARLARIEARLAIIEARS